MSCSGSLTEQGLRWIRSRIRDRPRDTRAGRKSGKRPGGTGVPGPSESVPPSGGAGCFEAYVTGSRGGGRTSPSCDKGVRRQAVRNRAAQVKRAPWVRETNRLPG